MSEQNQIDPSKIIYYMEEGQKLSLENYINASLVELKKIFQKEEILKFLFKNILEGKIDFREEIESEGKEVTEEEIALKQDNLCRELKKLFDKIKLDISTKYNNRIASASIKIMQAIYKRWKLTSNKIREVKVKVIDEDVEENKKKYENLDALKNIIQETISVSNLYISEINNADSFLPENLDDFYAEKSNIKFVNIVNGEEKTANEDDLIKKVVTQKENTGKEFILENKKFINEQIEEQNKLDKKINNMVNELENLKEQKIVFEKYCNEDSIFKEINDVDFYA
jgi:hypothetical protein